LPDPRKTFVGFDRSSTKVISVRSENVQDLQRGREKSTEDGCSAGNEQRANFGKKRYRVCCAGRPLRSSCLLLSTNRSDRLISETIKQNSSISYLRLKHGHATDETPLSRLDHSLRVLMPNEATGDCQINLAGIRAEFAARAVSAGKYTSVPTLQRASSGGTSSYCVPPGFSGVDPTGSPPMTSTVIFPGPLRMLCSTVDSRG
jgi:hypothetical protein